MVLSALPHQSSARLGRGLTAAAARSALMAAAGTAVALACSSTPALAQALTFTNRTIINGLGGNSVRGVYASGSTIYAATYEGLSISTNGGSSFTNRTTSSGLGNNTLFNSIPGTLRVILGAAIVSAFFLTIRRHFLSAL